MKKTNLLITILFVSMFNVVYSNFYTDDEINIKNIMAEVNCKLDAISQDILSIFKICDQIENYNKLQQQQISEESNATFKNLEEKIINLQNLIQTINQNNIDTIKILNSQINNLSNVFNPVKNNIKRLQQNETSTKNQRIIIFNYIQKVAEQIDVLIAKTTNIQNLETLNKTQIVGIINDIKNLKEQTENVITQINSLKESDTKINNLKKEIDSIKNDLNNKGNTPLIITTFISTILTCSIIWVSPKIKELGATVIKKIKDQKTKLFKPNHPELR
ncbi:MAG: hypothetical protein UR26_C0007G0002 [candidate division TM6 bacterium GW2011_GWF2_32_72]|nr:MAG: hypothetical protein UR26_C0007G0002 [candidate division TM6 bacterium GW2011_GWF2_32_72]